MRAELSRPFGVYTGAMLIAVTCPQCRHLGFIPKHMLTRSLVCSSCGTRAQLEGSEELKPWPVVEAHPQFPNEDLGI
jgi:hypothetical protein